VFDELNDNLHTNSKRVQTGSPEECYKPDGGVARSKLSAQRAAEAKCIGVMPDLVSNYTFHDDRLDWFGGLKLQSRRACCAVVQLAESATDNVESFQSSGS
jgi:hypothetical protein